MIPQELEHVLSKDPSVVSGAVCFTGTRVPVQALLDTLSGGGSLEEFQEGWPEVPREFALAVLRWEQDQARKVLGIQVTSRLDAFGMFSGGMTEEELTEALRPMTDEEAHAFIEGRY